MGDLRRDRLLGPRELLAIAVTEREIYNIRLLFRERHFYRKVNLIGELSVRNSLYSTSEQEPNFRMMFKDFLQNN